MSNDKVFVDKQLLEAVLNYLITKPFNEVVNVVLPLSKTLQEGTGQK